jgi:hypothetical protein
MKYSTLSITCMVAMFFIGLTAPLVRADDGRPANATVSFGQWQTAPPLDRFPPSPSNDPFRNEHQVIPRKVEIQAGGAVNFIISGFHQPIVYDDGTQPGDIQTNDTTTTTGPTPSPAVLLIDDPRDRLYRGPDPSLQPLERASSEKEVREFLQDRVEVVFFPKPGKYLVICGIHGHFVNDGMFGFVEVRRTDDHHD